MYECLEDADPNGEVSVEEIIAKLLEAGHIDEDFADELSERVDGGGGAVENFYALWYSKGMEGDPESILEALDLV